VSIEITKRNPKVWTNVDQYDLDKEITEERRKGLQKMLKRIHEDSAKKNYTIPMTQKALVKWEKGLTTKERRVLWIGLAGFLNMRKKPVYKCKICNDTGFVRTANGLFLLDSEGAKKSYQAGKAGSLDGLVAYSAPVKCLHGEDK
jgi:hypothetical protein